MSSQDNNRSRQGRIPATLQAVFLASNRGRDVNKPPPEKAASKIYFRNWLFQRQTGSKDKRGSLFAGSEKPRKKQEKHSSKSQPRSPPKSQAKRPTTASKRPTAEKPVPKPLPKAKVCKQ
jgi:hypothetical protein